MSWTRAMPLEEVPLGRARPVEIDGEALVLCRVSEDEVTAIENLCSHDDGPLGDGPFDNGVIECPRHGARFDVRTGVALRMPAASPIQTFPVRIHQGWVEVELEDS